MPGTEVSIFFFPNFVANMYSKDDHLKSRTMFQASIFFHLFFSYDYIIEFRNLVYDMAQFQDVIESPDQGFYIPLI